MASARDILVNLLGKETVSPAAGKAGRALDKLGDQAEDAAKDAKKLDDEIDDLSRDLVKLAAAYAAAGSEAERADIFKAIRGDQKTLRQKLNVRKLMGDVGKDGAEGFSVGFAQRIGPLVARAPLSPGLLAAVGAAVPVVAPAVANMLALGAAGGAVAIGAAISARNPVVAGALGALKDEIGDELSKSARPFGPAMLAEVDDVRKHFRALRPELDKVFSKASTYLDPLEDGAAGFLRTALPGFRKLVESAEPLVHVLGDELPELGEDFAEVLTDVAAAAREGGDELRVMLDTMGLLVRSSGGLLPVFTETNGLLELYNAQVEKAKDNGARWVEPTAEALKVAKFEASTAADALRSFREEQQKLINNQLGLEQATIDWQEAIDDTTEAAKENGKTLDKNTEKGRANRQALLDQAQAGLEYADKVYQEKAALGDVAAAEKAAEIAYQKSRAALVKSATQMGLSKQEAEDYVTEILGIPPTRNTNATFKGDNEAVRKWKQTLSGIPRHLFIKAEFDLINDREVALALRLGRLSKGGPVKGPGPKGVDSQPYLLAPGEHVLTAKEVDAAGGHGAITQWRKNLVRPSSAPVAVGNDASPYMPRTGGAAPAATAPVSTAVDERMVRTLTAAIDTNTREVRGLRQDLRSGLRIDDRTARIAGLYARGG